LRLRPRESFITAFIGAALELTSNDPTEHDVTPNDVRGYEQAVGKQTADLFREQLVESRKFPAAMCNWIRDFKKFRTSD